MSGRQPRPDAESDKICAHPLRSVHRLLPAQRDELLESVSTIQFLLINVQRPLAWLAHDRLHLNTRTAAAAWCSLGRPQRQSLAGECRRERRHLIGFCTCGSVLRADSTFARYFSTNISRVVRVVTEPPNSLPNSLATRFDYDGSCSAGNFTTS